MRKQIFCGVKCLFTVNYLSELITFQSKTLYLDKINIRARILAIYKKYLITLEVKIVSESNNFQGQITLKVF